MQKISVPPTTGTVCSFLSLFLLPFPPVRVMGAEKGTEKVLVEVSSWYTASSSKYTAKSS